MQLHILTVRLSYHDMRMFLQILKSLPQQMLTKSRSNVSEINGKSVFMLKHSFPSIIQFFPDDVAKLTALGFKREDCVTALQNCEGKLDDAALWLTQNAVPNRSLVAPAQETNTADNAVFIKAVEVYSHFMTFSFFYCCDFPGESQLHITVHYR